MARKTYSPKFKFQVVLETLSGDKSTAEIARAYEVHPNSVSRWHDQFMEQGPEVFAKDSTVQEYERKIGKLERLIGKKEVQIAMLKNFMGQPR